MKSKIEPKRGDRVRVTAKHGNTPREGTVIGTPQIKRVKHFQVRIDPPAGSPHHANGPELTFAAAEVEYIGRAAPAPAADGKGDGGNDGD